MGDNLDPMRRITRCVIPVGVALTLAAVWSSSTLAQHGYTRAEVENGARLYQASCATCHGGNGDQVRGVALFGGRFRAATTDDDLVRIIINGIPNTAMPPNRYSNEEAGMIVAYLRGVAAGDRVTTTAGDVARGRALFEGKGTCATCHHPAARLAPTLADVGTLRRPLEIERAILEPSADLHADFRFVRIVRRDGATTRGRLMNQSTFSVQILDTGERLRAFDRSEVTELVFEPTSPMPGYRGVLNAQELADVVAYLTTRRGQP
jgi:putative heme-binding domain-containing protein